MISKELSELQSELETLKEKNKQTEVNLLMEQGLSRVKVCLQDYELAMTLSLFADRSFDIYLSLRLKKWELCLWPSTALQSSVIYQHMDLWKT